MMYHERIILRPRITHALSIIGLRRWRHKRLVLSRSLRVLRPLVASEKYIQSFHLSLLVSSCAFNNFLFLRVVLEFLRSLLPSIKARYKIKSHIGIDVVLWRLISWRSLNWRGLLNSRHSWHRPLMNLILITFLWLVLF
jgi:hypothetical protein